MKFKNIQHSINYINVVLTNNFGFDEDKFLLKSQITFLNDVLESKGYKEDEILNILEVNILALALDSNLRNRNQFTECLSERIEHIRKNF